MWSLLLVSLLLTSEPVNVDVRPLAGGTVSGSLESITAGKISVKTDGDTKSFVFSDLEEISLRPLKAGAKTSAMMAELRDGSLVNLASYSAAKNQATLSLTGGQHMLQVKTGQIRTVRLKEPGKLENQWNEICAEQHSGDVIVLRKKKAGAEFTLDYLEGVLYDISSTQVEFEYEGERHEVPLSRVLGVIYYQPGAEEFPKSACRIVDVSGTAWNVRNLKMSDGMLHVDLVSGIKTDIPLATVARLDFSSGNVVYLGDLKMQSFAWQPFYRTESLSEQLTNLFGPSIDAFRDGGKLSLGGVTYAKGLSLHSKSTVRYLLPEGVRQFAGIAGIDDRSQGNGNVVLTISGDGKQLFRETIAGGQPAKEFKLDVSGSRRLTIHVDFGDDLDIADYLNLCNARFLR